MNYLKEHSFLFVLLLATLVVFSACSDDDVPAAENEEEIITKVTLTFTTLDETTVVATASDPDGEGPESIVVDGSIELEPDTQYQLTIELTNEIAGEDITEEVGEEASEHLFFFKWTEGLFDDPVGNGNIDDRNDPVNYLDIDSNNLPLGLTTEWTTGASQTGTFRVILKHQPDIKSATSTVEDGESDVDLEWDVTIN